MSEKVIPFGEVKEARVEMEGAKNVYIRWLLGPEDKMPNFYLRMFRIEKEGHTPYHSHPYEHEVFVLEGEGALIIENKEYQLKKGYVAYVPADSNHQFKNSGGEDFVFLCIIPRT
ncbi:MAG: cupin domain-containing protein [candidate division WOR-3 bacterium]